MKKQIIVSLSVVAAGIILSACGDDVTKVTNEVSGMEVVASADSFGKCESTNVGKTVFASDENTAYVCADSGWVPLSKKQEDVVCVAEQLSDSSGYKIICGGDSVGVVKNGLNGENGLDGKNGEKGENGTSCTVENLSDGSGYKVVCNGDSVGVITNGSNGEDGADGSGCSLTDNGDGTVTQVCGKDSVDLYKAFCSGKVYEPEKAFCFEDSLYSCGEKAYDPSKEICDFRDSSVYRYVKIGAQVWMAENLNYAYTEKTTDLDSLSFCYDNSADSCANYGRLYTWSAAMDSAARFSENGKDCGYGKTCSSTYPVRGACPEGWHLPSHDEWGILESYVASNSNDSASYALKSTSGWDNYFSRSGNGSDAFGFGIYPAGRYTADGFSNIRQYAYFWCSTEAGNQEVYSRNLSNELTGRMGIGLPKGWAASVRCVKD